MMFALMDIDQYSGSFELSSTKLTRNGMTSFELSVNSDVIDGYPLEQSGNDSIQFYHRFLRNTGRLDNPFSSTVMTHAQYDNCNFMMVHNFQDDAEQEGQLSCKMKFAQPLDKKLVLIYMPVSEKRLYFDNYFNVIKQ